MTNSVSANSPRWRLSKLFFYALIIFLPIQTSKIFFIPQSFYFGQHLFYNTFYFFLTDVLFIGIIIAWLWENIRISREISASPTSLWERLVSKVSSDKIYWFLFTFWLILALSLIFSHEISLGFYGLVKITEFVLIFAYIRESLTPSSSPPVRWRLRLSHGEEREGEISCEKYRLFWLILGTLWFQAGLGIYQYLNQTSADLKVLGEEFLRPGLQGIAEFYTNGLVNPIFSIFFPYLSTISGETVNIRAYGTLPHPNVLAGLLFFGLLLNVFLLYHKDLSRERFKTAVLASSLVLISTGLTLTFSRLAWAVTGLAILIWFVAVFWGVRRPNVMAMKLGALDKTNADYFPERLAVIAFLLLLSVGLNFAVFGRQIQDRLVGTARSQAKLEESFVDRNTLAKISWDIIRRNPVFGVGVKNFVVEMDNYARGERLLPYLHQPVHNIYLLIAAEAGVLALVIFGVVIYNIVRPSSRSLIGLRPVVNQTSLLGRPAGNKSQDQISRYTLLIIFFGFLFIGLFDHYFFTIQQGSLVFWVTLGLLTAKPAQDHLVDRTGL